MLSAVKLIGYSGHAFVVADIIRRGGGTLAGYFEPNEKEENPYDLPYLGSESEEAALPLLQNSAYFVAVGDNRLRARITRRLLEAGCLPPVNVIHPRANLGFNIQLGQGVMIAAGATLNALAVIGDGVICNTASVIEHECVIGPYTHIAPGAVLAGNVTVGASCFIGANAVVKPGIRIGREVTVGAGAVIIRDIPDGATVVGNPGRILK